MKGKKKRCRHVWWTKIYPCEITEDNKVELVCRKCDKEKMGFLREADDVKKHYVGVKDEFTGRWHTPEELENNLRGRDSTRQYVGREYSKNPVIKAVEWNKEPYAWKVLVAAIIYFVLGLIVGWWLL